MIYLYRVFNAIFRPQVLSRRISCKHPNETSHFIDVGMTKVFHCPDCGMTAFSYGTSA